MIKKIALAVIAVLVIFVCYVATRSGQFRYERSGLINASAEEIFPYISNFRLGSEWSPYEKMDPNMKKTYQGEDGQVGSAMDFEGNGQSGSGRLEILKIIPNESVDIRLTMTKPMGAENLVEYRLTPEAGGTRFTWAMSGDGGFVSKLMTILIDCDKMIGDQFNEGISSLKALVESKKNTQ